VASSESKSTPKNRRAGALLKAWRVDRGLSPEQLSWQIAEAQLGFISGRQIRRIESDGTIPTPRVMFALARFFDTTPTALWAPKGQAPMSAVSIAERRRRADRRAERERRTAMAA
jgi:transcriptional regulator with XRE-family HTH domain